MEHPLPKSNKEVINKAMLFAAGLGTRLHPLTKDRPKALVELAGKPLLERAILQLKKSGIHELVINVHHFAEMIENFLKEKNNFGLRIYLSDEREQLLETGGGLLKAKHWFENDPFLAMNTDVVSDIDLKTLISAHFTNKAIATLAIRQRKTSRYLLFDENLQLLGWENTKTGVRKMSRPVKEYTPYGFSGIQIIHPKLFDYMPEQLDKFSIIDTYLTAAKSEVVKGFCHDEDVWFDVGKPAQLQAAALEVETIYGE